MCGIFGIFNKEKSISTCSININSAVASLQHRGPDDYNVYESENAIIGHTRLSIIDLDQGQQPMQSQNGRWVIAFNGEVFNYRELRKKLQHEGYTFLTNSDTEVVLAAYQLYEHQCLELFRGMFAFVVYDTETKNFFAARDRFGIKPFFFTWTNNYFIFSSEIKAIYQTGLVAFEPKSEHFNEYLIFGYIAGEETLHRHINELKPAHYICSKKQPFVQKKYWQPFDDTIINDSEDDIIDQLDVLTKDAVSLWTTADVEVASLLSGGVDSSLLTSLASKPIPHLRTITAYMRNEPSFDEREYAKLVSSRIAGESLEIPITEIYILENLERLAKHFDDPIHDPNYFTLMAICEGIRKQSDLKVLLCGEGADELFGGYARHRTIAEEYETNKDPDILCYALNRVAIPRLHLFSDDVSINSSYRYKLQEQLKSKDAINNVLELDQQMFLNSYLHRQDRVGMMFGLEIRTPFLEHELAQFVNRLPARLKINNIVHKYILRKVAERYVPHEIIWNPKKVAFAAPISQALYNGELRSKFTHLLSSESEIAKYYSTDGIQTLLSQHIPSQSGCDHSNTLWRLLSLELWLRTSH